MKVYKVSVYVSFDDFIRALPGGRILMCVLTEKQLRELQKRLRAKKPVAKKR